MTEAICSESLTTLTAKYYKTMLEKGSFLKLILVSIYNKLLFIIEKKRDLNELSQKW